MFVARMEDTRLPKCVMFLGGGGLTVWGARKKSGCCCSGVFLGRPQSFRHQRRPVDDCSPGRGGMAQNSGTFYGEMDRCRESQAELRHVVVCSNVTGRTKERITQSKRARAGSLTLVDYYSHK